MHKSESWVNSALSFYIKRYGYTHLLLEYSMYVGAQVKTRIDLNNIKMLNVLFLIFDILAELSWSRKLVVIYDFLYDFVIWS